MVYTYMYVYSPMFKIYKLWIDIDALPTPAKHADRGLTIVIYIFWEKHLSCKALLIN